MVALKPLLLLCTLFIFLSCSFAREILTPATPLPDGETLVSAGGNFALGFFTPPGSKYRYVGIWYNKVSVQTVVWVANRLKPIANETGVLSISGSAILSITSNNSGRIIWSTTAARLKNPVAHLLDDGNFVIREAIDDGSGSYAWQSFDYPTDTLLPGMKLGWDLTAGVDRNLTAWSSASDPSPGLYSISLDARGDPQLFLRAGPATVWRGGPWVGLHFSGVPEMTTFTMLNYSFTRSKNEAFFMYRMLNSSVTLRMTVDHFGTVRQLVWLTPPGQWQIFSLWPKDQCDTFTNCGPFGLCNANTSPVCSCLQGFEPRSPRNWELRDGSGGCKRKTMLDCSANTTDGFVTLENAKLPDTSASKVYMSVGLDECKIMCLRNCSCMAYSSADAANGGTGCLIWISDLVDLRLFTDGGQQFFVRLAADDIENINSSQSSQKRKLHKRKRAIVLIAVASLMMILLITWIGCIAWKKKKNRKVEASYNFQYRDQEHADANDMELPVFDLNSIIIATENFSLQNKLGEGGFGPVYKGRLVDGTDIAVKRLSNSSVQGGNEFKNEVRLIARLQHRNLVRLLGCCTEGDERILIYEYMHNKSLDAFLFDKQKSASLDWTTRYHIIIGIGRGLLYLHQDSRFRIIHRDLKASNILLDKDMNPKISDFGIARIVGGDETEAKTKHVMGTFGYMSPEYAMDGTFSMKSDVYSFGVLVLEIISGKRNRGVFHSNPDLNLLGHAWSLWMDRRALELVDESINSQILMDEVLRYIKIGLLCVQENPEDRPTMSSAIIMLVSDNMVLPNPKKPGFISVKGSQSTSKSYSTGKGNSSSMDISITMLLGR